jgi:hypothetical protein
MYNCARSVVRGEMDWAFQVCWGTVYLYMPAECLVDMWRWEWACWLQDLTVANLQWKYDQAQEDSAW